MKLVLELKDNYYIPQKQVVSKLMLIKGGNNAVLLFRDDDIIETMSETYLQYDDPNLVKKIKEMLDN